MGGANEVALPQKNKTMSVKMKGWKKQWNEFSTKEYMTSRRYVGSYPKLKRFVLIDFLFLVIGFIGWNISLSVPEISLKWDKEPLTFENPAIASTMKTVEIREEIKTTISAESIADTIHKLESSKGKNNYSKCEAQGKFNEYGFGVPGNGTYICFDKGKDRVSVIGWIEQKIAQGYTEKELACVYNTGKRTETCPYGEHFGQ